MSAIIHLMGRVTKDPVMQQGWNNGTEYISLDLATSQRSQNAQNNPENSADAESRQEVENGCLDSILAA